MKHVEFAKLVEKFEGQLTTAEELEMTAHVGTCRDCETDLRKLTNFFGYSALRSGEPVPQWVTAGILNIYQRRPKANQPVVAASRGIASLIFDDWSMAVNERYSGLDTRQMLYRVNGFDIDLRIELVGDKCRLTGQLFPESNGAIAVISSAENVVSTSLNEFGEFVFEPVPPGTYDLKITVGSEEFILEEVPLKR